MTGSADQASNMGAGLPIGLVLGAAVWPGGRPSPSLKRRADHAAHLYLTGRVGVIIGCGGIGQHPPSEASVICDICRDAGVPDHALVQESASTTTYENILFARQMLQGDGSQHVMIVTDRYHATRARMVARRLGVRADTSSPALKDVPVKARAKAYIREAAALAWYWIKLR